MVVSIGLSLDLWLCCVIIIESIVIVCIVVNIYCIIILLSLIAVVL